MSLLIHKTSECDVLVRDDFLNKKGKNQDMIYCRQVQTNDVYRVRDLKSHGFMPEIIVDIGAQIGTFSMMARKYWPTAKVISYEPLGKPFQLLIRNATGAVHHNKAVIGYYKKEVGKQIHKCVYHQTDPEARFRSGRLDNAVCVEEMFAENTIDHIDFLKIDCEECEVNIFRELLELDQARNIEYVHGEWHGEASEAEVRRTFDGTHSIEVQNSGGRGGAFYCKRT